MACGQASEVVSCGEHQPLALAFGDADRRRRNPPPPPQPHLDEHQHPAVAADEVDLPPRTR